MQWMFMRFYEAEIASNGGCQSNVKWKKFYTTHTNSKTKNISNGFHLCILLLVQSAILHDSIGK